MFILDKLKYSTVKNIKRRKFLAMSTAATGSLLLPFSCASTAKPNNSPDKKRIGVALVGLGGYSTYQLAPALQMTQHCYLAGIVTGSPEKIPTWQQKYQIPDANVYSYETMAQIADNPDIDVIYIVTPTATHAQFAITAAQTGKQVWCEKPMAMTVAECQSIIDACANNKVQLTIGYRMQHEPNTLTLNSYAQTKPFGDFTKVEATAGYAGGGGSGWRFEKAMGGGALYDMGVYTVNGMRKAIDLYPTRVLSARQFTTRPQLFTEVDETTEYVLEFENGLKGYGRTSVGENMNHLRVDCERGWYEVRPMQPYSGVKGERSDGVQLDQVIENQQARQMDEDALALLNGEKMKIDGTEGLKDIRIIEAIIKSAAEGRVVDI